MELGTIAGEAILSAVLVFGWLDAAWDATAEALNVSPLQAMALARKQVEILLTDQALILVALLAADVVKHARTVSAVEHLDAGLSLSSIVQLAVALTIAEGLGHKAS